jgi:WD40 repeat protein
VSASRDKSIIFWDVSSHQMLGPPLIKHNGAVESVAFDSNGKILASASEDKSIIFWDVATRQPIGSPSTVHTAAVLSLAFSPDGSILASGADDGTILLWDVATQQDIGLYLDGHQGSISSISFSPDGKTLASAGLEHRNILLWEVSPEAWQVRACQIANRDFARNEWAQYFGTEPYRPTCRPSPH